MSNTESIEVRPDGPDKPAAPRGEKSAFRLGSLAQVVIFVALGVLTFFVLGSIFTDAATYAGIVESLDAKRTTILELIAGSAAASVAVGAIGSAGTAIANELMSMSGNFALVLAAIYLEKYLLTLLGALTFKILIPAACVAKIVAVFMDAESSMRATVSQIANKAVLLGIALVLVVPCSVWVSDKVEETHAAYKAIEAEAVQEDAAVVEEEAAPAQKQQESEAANAAEQEEETADFGAAALGLLDSLKDKAAAAADAVADTAQGVADAAGEAVDSALSTAESFVNDLVEAFAIMIVTSCLIPILVLVLFIWIINTILGTSISMPKRVSVKPFRKKEEKE